MKYLPGKLPNQTKLNKTQTREPPLNNINHKILLILEGGWSVFIHAVHAVNKYLLSTYSVRFLSKAHAPPVPYGSVETQVSGQEAGNGRWMGATPTGVVHAAPVLTLGGAAHSALPAPGWGMGWEALLVCLGGHPAEVLPALECKRTVENLEPLS